MKRKRYYSTAKQARTRRGREISVSRLQSENTRLWFGQYRGKCIKDIPQDYLRFLMTIEVDKSNWRMLTLIRFIASYVRAQQEQGKPTRSV